MNLQAPKYKYFATIADVLQLPEKTHNSIKLHKRSTPFQDECKPYVNRDARKAFVDMSNTNTSGIHTKLAHTFGLSWEKLSFPDNPIVASVVANECTHFLPKGYTDEERKRALDTCSFLMIPTPLTLHECTHVEVLLTMKSAAPGVRLPTLVNPHFCDKLKDFEWKKYWDPEDPERGSAYFVPCDTVQQMLDDLCVVVG